MKLRKIVVDREHFNEIRERFETTLRSHEDNGDLGYINLEKGVEVFYHVKQMPAMPPPGLTTDPVNYFL